MNAALQDNHFQFHILDHLSTAVLMTNTQYQIVLVNTAAEDLFGISRRRIHYFNLATICINGDELSLHDFLKSKHLEGHSCTYHELCIKPPAACEKMVNCTITPLNRDIQNGGILIELKQVDRILKITAEEQLIAQHLTAREIARGLAHEINNPLGGLRGAAQLLEREIPASAREYTQIIINEADRLQKLVANMLGPRAKPNKTVINIHEILDHVIKLIEAESDGRCTIKLDIDPSIPNIYVDRDQIIQAILNLVRNAWQAIDNDGWVILKTRTHRHFTIGRQSYRLALQIDIIDNGCGIPEDKRKQIFYPMVTGRSEGTGLGLTIAQSLISLHNGLIECSSKPGETVFSILLPFNSDTEKQDG